MAGRKPEVPAGADSEHEGARADVENHELKSVYANVCDVVCRREEAVLSFGVSQQGHEQGPTTVEARLTSRLIVSPFAAKRLAQLLSRFVAEYEERYGSLKAGKEAV